METQVLIKLSAMIDKMGIDLVGIEGKDKEEVGTMLISLLIKNLYKAETELYELISIYKKIEIDKAKEYDAITFIKELLKIDGVKDFLA